MEKNVTASALALTAMLTGNTDETQIADALDSPKAQENLLKIAAAMRGMQKNIDNGTEISR